MNRRSFVARSAVLAATATVIPSASEGAELAQQQPREPPLPEAVRNLQPATQNPPSITDDERRARIEKARKLLRDVPWTGDDAAHAIMGRAKALGYSAQPGPRWNEVDRPEELTRLAERLKTSGDPDDVRLLTELERIVPRGEKS